MSSRKNTAKDFFNEAAEKHYRKGFSDRMRALIQAEPASAKLVTVSKKLGITINHLSQWQSAHRTEWPSMPNFYRLCHGTKLEPCFFMFGHEHEKRPKITVAEAIEVILEEHANDQAKMELVKLLNRLSEQYDQGHKSVHSSKARRGHQAHSKTSRRKANGD